MSSNNSQTVQAYDGHVDDYIALTPPVLTEEFTPWLDGSLAELAPPARILELGSANGRDAAYMENKGFTVERTDASKSFVAYLEKQGYTARQLNALTDDLGYGYDMVFANAVLLHFTREEAAKVMRKVYDALKPGGRFLFSLKEGDGDEVESAKFGVPRYFSYWRMADAERLATDAGFTVEWKKINRDVRPGKPGWLLLTAAKRVGS